MQANHHGFDVMVTGDKNIIYQQNNLNRRIALVLLSEIKRRLIVADATVIRAQSPAPFPEALSIFRFAAS